MLLSWSFSENTLSRRLCVQGNFAESFSVSIHEGTNFFNPASYALLPAIYSWSVRILVDRGGQHIFCRRNGGIGAGIFFWGNALIFFEQLHEIGDVLKTGHIADLLDGYVEKQQLAGIGKPRTGQILVVGKAGLFLEAAAKIAFAVAKLVGDLLQRNLLAEIIPRPANQRVQVNVPGIFANKLFWLDRLAPIL